jgi:hypothetical protein
MLGRSAYCAVTPTGDAEELARAINETLALGQPSGLREIAADYGIEASIAAHTDQMVALMGAG